MPNGKTIRQIADEIGVTRQAIYKKFKLHSAIANNIKAYSFTVDRVKYYTAEGEKIIKSLFTNNYDVPQETADVSTEQFTSDNLTTAQVDRLTHQLTDELTGLQDDKTRIKSAFSDSSTPQETADVSTEQFTSDNLTTDQVDRLTHQLTDELTGLQDDKTQIKSVFSDSSTPQETADVSTEQFTPDNLTTAKVDRLTHQLTDELTGLQDDKTRIKSVFSDSSTPQETADVSTEQFTSDNLTTDQVDRLTHQLTVLFSAQLTTKDKQLEEKDRQLAEKDKQIALLMEQTNNLTQALQAAQALAAADKQQLLLQAGKQNEQLENTQKQETAKKSFFSRIFIYI